MVLRAISQTTFLSLVEFAFASKAIVRTSFVDHCTRWNPFLCSDYLALLLIIIQNKYRKVGAFNPNFKFLSVLLILVQYGGLSLLAQSPTDTAYSFPTVEVTSTKIRTQTVGSSGQTWTSKALEKLPANNLAQLMMNEAGTYIKSYSLGNLATSSIRGGSAGHTLVLWNGLPIQSPMLGQLDLSLLPVQSVESITFTRGGNTALWGSGAIGGVLSLENQANFKQRLVAQSNSEVGSFGHFRQQLDLGLGNQKFRSVTRFLHQEADNDFFYFVAPDFPDRQQDNARLSQQYLLQDFYWKISPRSQLALHYWWQQSDRQIPPTNVENQSLAHQDDLANRLILDFQQVTKQGLWKVKTGFFDEHLNFFNDLTMFESRSRFRTYLAEATGQWNWFKRHQFLVGNTHTQTRAWSAGYRENIPSEYRTALFASWKYQGEKLQSQVSLRQEIVDGDLIPLVPALGLEYALSQHWQLKGKVSRNYRLATFNDRFWMPGGNPELLPESGWSEELSLAYQLEKKTLQTKVSLTAFNRQIDNWILWSIREGQVFWSANNITRVWSRGLEPRLSMSYAFSDLKLSLRGGYDYIRSTNQVALERPSLDAGQQLVYNPTHQAFGSIALTWKGLHFAYQHNYTGAANGVSDPLEAFQVGQIRLQYAGAFKQYRAKLYFNLNNVWDADYIVVERRPMPGIHFQTGIKVSFHQASANAQ